MKAYNKFSNSIADIPDESSDLEMVQMIARPMEDCFKEMIGVYPNGSEQFEEDIKSISGFNTTIKRNRS